MAENKEQGENTSVNPLGLVVHLIAALLFCHAALTYIAFPGYLDNWIPAAASIFLPIINLIFGAYYGLLGYWEISWPLTILILFFGFGALTPKIPGYIFSMLFVVTTFGAIYYSSPDVSSIPDGRGAAQVVYDRAAKEVSGPRGLDSRAGIETVIEFARTYRARCIRTDKERCAFVLKLMIDSSKEVLNDPRVN